MIKINGNTIRDGILDWFEDEDGRINLVLLGDDENAQIYAKRDNAYENLDITITEDFLKNIAKKKPSKMINRVKFTGSIVGGKAKGKAEIETALGTLNIDDTGNVGISGTIEL